MSEYPKPTFSIIFIVVAVVLFFVGTILLTNYFVDYKKEKTTEIKSKIENTFSDLEQLKEQGDSANAKIDSIQVEILTSLQQYKEYLKTNHYEKDSAYIYINNVHIDSLLAKLPRFNEEQ